MRFGLLLRRNSILQVNGFCGKFASLLVLQPVPMCGTSYNYDSGLQEKVKLNWFFA